jgi:hypothetical protein
MSSNVAASNTIIGAHTLMLSFRPTFPSLAIAVVRKRTSSEVSAVQRPECVATSPFLRRRPTVTAHDFQLPAPAPSHLEGERSFQRPSSFVFQGLIGAVLAVNIVATVLSLMA